MVHPNIVLPRAMRTMKHCPLKTPEVPSCGRSIAAIFGEED